MSVCVTPGGVGASTKWGLVKVSLLDPSHQVPLHLSHLMYTRARAHSPSPCLSTSVGDDCGSARQADTGHQVWRARIVRARRLCAVCDFNQHLTLTFIQHIRESRADRVRGQGAARRVSTHQQFRANVTRAPSITFAAAQLICVCHVLPGLLLNQGRGLASGTETMYSSATPLCDDHCHNLTCPRHPVSPTTSTAVYATPCGCMTCATPRLPCQGALFPLHPRSSSS
jgi:hypothetical protein